MLNKFGPSGHGEAQVQYLDGDFRVISPGTYDDSRRITDLLRSNRAVVLTTLDVDQVLARRQDRDGHRQAAPADHR